MQIHFGNQKLLLIKEKFGQKSKQKKNGKQNFNKDIGHKMLNFLFFILYDIIITNIVIRYIKATTIFTKIKYI